MIKNTERKDAMTKQTHKIAANDFFNLYAFKAISPFFLK